jgi:DNA polymerase IV
VERHIIHLHVPAFPIAVARIGEPSLRERPVVVAPTHRERAVVFSVSSEARQEGIFRGMALGQARNRCPGLTVISPDPARTECACRHLSELASAYTPLWEPERPGNIYLDLTGTERLWGRARDTAQRLQREIDHRLRLPAAIGVAANKLVSGIASRILPAEEVLDVQPGNEATFMAPLKVGMVPGIDQAQQKLLLEELNISRVRQLAVLDAPNLKLIFGMQAVVIRQRALGIDPTPVYAKADTPVVSEEVSLVPDENDDHALRGALYRLVEHGARRLRAQALFPRRTMLLIRYADQQQSRRQVRLSPPSLWEFELYAPLEKLFLKACTRRVRVRFMKVWFWDFSSRLQPSLFPEISPGAERKSRMIKAMDQIRGRYGEEAIWVGRTEMLQCKMQI